MKKVCILLILLTYEYKDERFRKRKKCLFLNSFHDEEKTLLYRISAYHSTCMFKILFIRKTFLYLMLSQPNPVAEMILYLHKAHSDYYRLCSIRREAVSV
jgi:hypothetical protein